jgi:hypothetical protein
VRFYCDHHQEVVEHNEVWNFLFDALNVRYEFDAAGFARGTGWTPLDVTEQEGMLPDLYAVACDLLAPARKRRGKGGAYAAPSAG